jgi:hypothetical protein
MNSPVTISRLALVQFLVVVIGVLTTCAMLKLHQYDPETARNPEAWMRWNPVAVAVRSCGYLLLVAPALWMIGSVVLERRAPQYWSRGWTITAGILLIAFLFGFLAWTTIYRYFPVKVPFREW